MIPPNASCMVSGCKGTVTHLLSLRMRREDTGADWAPNLPAYFCSEHANSGSEIVLIYHPTRTGTNAIEVCVGSQTVNRTTKIRP